MDQVIRKSRGSGAAIGSPITGGTVNEVLYLDSSGNLAQSSNLIFDGLDLFLDGTVVPKGFGSSGQTARWTGSSTLGDGTLGDDGTGLLTTQNFNVLDDGVTGSVGIGNIPSTITGYKVLTINGPDGGGLLDFQILGTSYGYVYLSGEGINFDSIPDLKIKFNINSGNAGYFTSTGFNANGGIFTVGTETAYGLGAQVAQAGPALFRIIQTNASTHDGVWSFDAEGDSFYWGTSSQNYCQITRDAGGIQQFNIMWGIIDSYQTIRVLSSSIGIKTGAGTPVSMVDIAGNVTIGAGAACVTAAPTSGLYVEGDVQLKTLVSKYKNVSTAGWGVPAIYGRGRSTAQTAAVASVSTYTCGAADGSFLISANVLVTTATVHSFTATVTYTDEGNTSRTVTMQFSTLAGAFVTAMTNAQGTVPYEGVPLHIRAKASTAITIATTGTFTTVVYNVEGNITQIA